MKIVFVSNYYNSHQSALSESLYRNLNGHFYFIETNRSELESKTSGGGEAREANFVVSTGNTQHIYNTIDNADILILGNTPNNIEERYLGKKIILKYSERFFKENHFLKTIHCTLSCRKKYCGIENMYMLCASGYTARDCSLMGLFEQRMYKWGYFPEVKRYDDIDQLIKLKQPASILWVARLIEWKHPEVPLEVAKRLKEEGYSFSLDVIGNGKLEEQLYKQIQEFGIQDCVHLLGSMKPEQVREYMEQSEIFMFTSDFNEGWGAVLNESMNSGCAVVASHAIGSVPFLLKNGENGLIYENGNTESCYQKVKYLLDHPTERKEIGKKAYFTLRDTWNAEVATERLLKLSQALLVGEKHPNLFEDGPCSKAEIIKNNWFKEHR